MHVPSTRGTTPVTRPAGRPARLAVTRGPEASRTPSGLGRARAGLLAAALALVLAVQPTPALAATSPQDAAAGAAGWLAGQLIDGERLEVVFDGVTYPDQGGTADVVLALAAAGVASGQRTAATDWLVSEARGYTGLDWEGAYAGAIAKLALTLMADGRDPTDVDGLDLVALLQERELGADAGDEEGRFQDEPASEWASSFNQALALLALHRAEGVSPSAASIAFLAAQQCDDGGIRFTPDEADEAGTATCTSDVDTTALAVQALVEVGGDRAVVDRAIEWLRDQQRDDGAVGNANSTGLSAVAFSLAGTQAEATAARDHLLTLQDGCDAEEPGPIRDPDGGDVVRSTAQAIPGLLGVPFSRTGSGGSNADVPTLRCDDGGLRPVVLVPVVIVLLLAAAVLALRIRAVRRSRARRTTAPGRS